MAASIVPPPALPRSRGPEEARVPTATLVTWSLPALATGFMMGLVTLYLLKYATDVLLVAPATMGLLFGVARIWDAFSDPLVGHWSDRTRLGRRRPWFLGSVIPVGLCFVALWSPPGGLAGVSLTLWMGAAVLLFFTAYTAFNIPHAALGAELSQEHHDRTRVFAVRAFVELAGVLLAAGALGVMERSAEPRSTATSLAALCALVGGTLVLYSTFRLRERPDYQGRGGESPIRAFRDVFRNPHALLIIVILLLETLGFAAMTTIMPFATDYAFDLRGHTSTVLGTAIGSMLLGLPIWLPLSRRVGKRNLWLATLWIKAAAFGGLFFTPAGALVPLIIGVIVIGATHGCGMVIGPSIKADIVDWDEVQSGERKEGVYFATWNLASKSAAGFAIALGGVALGAAGFVPNAVQEPDTRLVIRCLFALAPCACYSIAALLLKRFSLDEQEHRRIRATLAARAA
jgi:GPH family glycoside/pentoside/hexuronide:cation symporter